MLSSEFSGRARQLVPSHIIFTTSNLEFECIFFFQHSAASLLSPIKILPCILSRFLSFSKFNFLKFVTFYIGIFKCLFYWRICLITPSAQTVFYLKLTILFDSQPSLSIILNFSGDPGIRSIVCLNFSS